MDGQVKGNTVSLQTFNVGGFANHRRRIVVRWLLYIPIDLV